MAFTKTYKQMLADQEEIDRKQYREWLAKEPEREAARKAAQAAYFAELNAREARLAGVAASMLTGDGAMTQLAAAYAADNSDHDEDFVEEFRAVLKAWENQQKVVSP